MFKHISRQTLYYSLLVLLLLIVSQHNFLLFHFLSEILGAVIIFAVFSFTWNTRKFLPDGYLLFIGTTLIFSGFLDLLHTVSFNGSDIVSLSGYDKNASCHLWLSSRFIQAVSFVVASFFIHKKVKIVNLLIIYHIVLIAVIGAVFFLHILPECYEADKITTFKRGIELVITLIFMMALILFWLKRHEFEKSIRITFIHALVLMFFSELMFAIQRSPHDALSTISLLLKIIAFLFIYRAIIVAGLRHPVKILFHDLHQSREKLLENKKQLEVEIQKAVEEVEEKNKMLVLQSRHAQLGEMIAAVSHQWKQPLNQISVLSSALIDAFRYNELDEEFLNNTVENISSVVKDMDTILNDFRNFYRPQEKDTIFEISEVLEPLQALIGRRLEKYDIDFVTYIEDDLEIQGKLNEMIQVLLVLINNSVDAISNNNVARGKISLNAEEIDDTISIILRDNGGGMKPSLLDNLFKPYFTTKGERGTGMGLFLARIIIQKHFEGKIFARNYLNGMEFCINIPGDPG